MRLRGYFALLAVLAAPALARADDIRIIGDSIGEGLHLASNYPSPANRFNVAIYTGKAIDQIKTMPRGANVVLSLGTNDAVGGLTDQKPKVDAIVAAATAQGIKLTWVGPPCVLTKWEVHSRALDANLAAALKGTDVAYVSAQDPEFCSSALHAGDGVHFSMAGYSRIWQKAATVAGIPVVVASAATPRPVAAVGSKSHRYNAKKRHHKATKTPQPAPT
jgi:hypothetical protein